MKTKRPSRRGLLKGMTDHQIEEMQRDAQRYLGHSLSFDENGNCTNVAGLISEEQYRRARGEAS